MMPTWTVEMTRTEQEDVHPSDVTADAEVLLKASAGRSRAAVETVVQAGVGVREHGQCAWSPVRTVLQDCQVMRRMTAVMTRPMIGSPIGTPIATTRADATTASET